MTREEIDRTLEAFEAGNDPAKGRHISDLQALAEIVADQERRLRVLEPCPSRTDGGSHWWHEGQCKDCNLRRTT